MKMIYTEIALIFVFVCARARQFAKWRQKTKHARSQKREHTSEKTMARPPKLQEGHLQPHSTALDCPLNAPCEQGRTE